MPTETTWMNYNVDLSSLAGNNYMIGFKVYSSTSTSTYFYIDHVVGPELAALVPEPAMLVYPADAGYAFLDASLSWNAAGSGGIPTSYDVYFGTTNPPDYVTNQAELTYTPPLAAATTYYWQIVPRNGTGPAENCPVWSFTTPTATQLAESFDATTFPPLGWLRMTSSTSYWGRSTTSPFYGAASMYASTSTSTPYTISTPVLAIDATSGLDFYAKASATTQVLQVLQSTDRTTWTQVGADITFAATGIWYPVSIDLSGLTPGNYYLAFHSPTQTAASYIYVDHLIGPEQAAVAPGPVTLSAPADAAIDQTQFSDLHLDSPHFGRSSHGIQGLLRHEHRSHHRDRRRDRTEASPRPQPSPIPTFIIGKWWPTMLPAIPPAIRSAASQSWQTPRSTPCPGWKISAPPAPLSRP
jgi:hypothetical protein